VTHNRYLRKFSVVTVSPGGGMLVCQNQ